MPKKLGAKLRKARENLDLTQEQLSNSVGLSSEFISLIEIGKRSPSLTSLKKIAGFLKKDMAYFLSEEENAFNILMKERALDKKSKAEIKKFRKYCEDYLRIEAALGRKLELAPAYTHISPERMAFEERRRIGLGDEPVRDIFSLVEMNGLRLFRQSIPKESKLSGIFIFFETEQSAFAMVSSSLPLGQQVLMAAHEYGHYLKDRSGGPILDNLDILVDEYLPLYHPREKFAQEFALQFLLPQNKLKLIIQREFRTKSLNSEDIIYLKRYFGVGTNVMLQALLKLDYLSLQKFTEFSRVDHTAYEESLFGNLIGDAKPARGKSRTITSDRYKSLGVTVYQKKAGSKNS